MNDARQGFQSINLKPGYRRSAHCQTVAHVEHALLDLLGEQGRTLADGIETEAHLRLIRERLLSGSPNVATDGGLRSAKPPQRPEYPSPFFKLGTCEQERQMRACVQAFYNLPALPRAPAVWGGFCAEDDEPAP